MNFDKNTLIPALFMVTAGLAVVFGVWQYRKLQNAKANHTHSALAQGHAKPRGERPERAQPAGAPWAPGPRG